LVSLLATLSLRSAIPRRLLDRSKMKAA
jgi:hypothetical protein